MEEIIDEEETFEPKNNIEIEKQDPIESLKNLLSVLSDKNISSSLKGAKISINITFGDE